LLLREDEADELVDAFELARSARGGRVELVPLGERDEVLVQRARRARDCAGERVEGAAFLIAERRVEVAGGARRGVHPILHVTSLPR
jgi:hypothetical protein